MSITKGVVLVLVSLHMLAMFLFYYGFIQIKIQIGVSEYSPKVTFLDDHDRDVKPVICIAMPVTSRMMDKLTCDTLPLFTMFMEPFLKYSEPNTYIYYFYLGYDLGDTFYDNPENRKNVLLYFSEFLNGRTSSPSSFILKLFPTSYPQHPTKGVPAWVASDMARQCYDDHAEYIFKLNDDVALTTENFTSILISDLQQRPIPNFGMNCPRHTGGKTTICVIDFTHRTHLEVFQYHYPRVFTNWFCDDWISYVYGELNESPYAKQLATVGAVHFVKQQRYEVGPANCASLGEEMVVGRDQVALYVHRNYPSVNYVFGQKAPC